MPTYTPFPTATSIQLSQHIRSLGDLVVISDEVSQDVIHVGVSAGGGDFLTNRCNHGADHKAEAVIEASIDLGDIEKGNIFFDHENDIYTLILPPPSITNCSVEVRQFNRSQPRVFECDVNWYRVRSLAKAQAIIDFVNHALENNILKRAKKQAATIAESLVNALTGSNANIHFADLDGELELPLSCQPEIPSGWQKNEDGAWKKED